MSADVAMRHHVRSPKGLVVREVVLRDFRSYPRLELTLEAGVVLVTGPNGAGKTNLLEALHVGTQGFSPRARNDAQMVRFGAEAARVRVRGESGSTPFQAELDLGVREPKRARLNGAPLSSAEQLRLELRTLVFTPDRLGVVKGAPATRRAYLDRSLGRLFPARAALPAEYASAVGQRNAALRRLAAGISTREALDPWTEAVATLGRELVEARKDTVSLLAPEFAAIAERLGLVDATISYDVTSPTAAELHERLTRDLERGLTGAGPHLHDVELRAGNRELRHYASQGEQRVAVLSLVLAEADAIGSRTGVPPLVLLDDVLSELDGDRRLALAALIAADGGQTIVTATSRAAFPAEPAQALVVSPGTVRQE
jgi:DNA replication and repair protein RecF